MERGYIFLIELTKPRSMYAVRQGTSVGGTFFPSGIRSSESPIRGQGTLLYPITSSSLLHFKNM